MGNNKGDELLERAAQALRAQREQDVHKIKQRFHNRFGIAPDEVTGGEVIYYLRVGDLDIGYDMREDAYWLRGKCPKCGQVCRSRKFRDLAGLGHLGKRFVPGMAHRLVCPNFTAEGYEKK